ncbi:hypothetical protein [Williamsia sp. DF01-3]|uniref:hypothetical protein n=1 Tax=Williamsia sp. DF01-3 TaxID=2934157 RepID=UPI001FF5A1A7|nr:hypothetical protein [Williamsia sp. DF01-3]MCK0517100.1 hypothetical protein [Williamsia sp. DF01-3]
MRNFDSVDDCRHERVYGGLSGVSCDAEDMNTPVPHVLNPQPRPRLLLLLDGDPNVGSRAEDAPLMHRWYPIVAHLPGSYQFITSLAQVDSTEWDAIITTEPIAGPPPPQTSAAPSIRRLKAPRGQVLPPHLFVLHIFSEADGVREMPVDVLIDTAGNQRVLASAYEPGRIIRAGTMPLDDRLEELRDQLVDTAQTRQYPFGVRFRDSDGAEVPTYQTLAEGPEHLALAGRYVRDNVGVWFLPDDVSDIAGWWQAVLRDWHSIDPVKFPDLPGWIENYKWLSYDEQQVADDIETERRRFAGETLAHHERIRELRDRAAAAVDTPVKQLLSGTGLPLQDAVRDVLREIGYTVEDMDASGKFNEREPREDFRITEPGTDQWLVIGDATGVAKGAKGAKITTLGTYTGAYEREEQPGFRPRQWLFINRMIAREPTDRGETIFRQDDREALVAALGLAIDTAALFVAHRAMKRGSITAQQIRDELRERTGELTLRDVTAWLGTND